ncbi:hypothetical protein ACWEPM_31355, partial [Streptomyces sp. NPDC004244]
MTGVGERLERDAARVRQGGSARRAYASGCTRTGVRADRTGRCDGRLPRRPAYAVGRRFLAPFLGEDNFLGTPYANSTVRTKLIPESRK